MDAVVLAKQVKDVVFTKTLLYPNCPDIGNVHVEARVIFLFAPTVIPPFAVNNPVVVNAPAIPTTPLIVVVFVVPVLITTDVAVDDPKFNVVALSKDVVLIFPFAVINPEAVTAATVESPVTPSVNGVVIPPFAVNNPAIPTAPLIVVVFDVPELIITDVAVDVPNDNVVALSKDVVLIFPFAVINPEAVTAATVERPVTPSVDDVVIPPFAVINPEAVTAATVESPVTPSVDDVVIPPFAVINPEAVTAATVERPVTPSVDDVVIPPFAVNNPTIPTAPLIVVVFVVPVLITTDVAVDVPNDNVPVVSIVGIPKYDVPLKMVELFAFPIVIVEAFVLPISKFNPDVETSMDGVPNVGVLMLLYY